MENIIKKAIDGGYAIQQSYYVHPVSFTALKHTNEYHTVFELDYTTVIEDENGEEKTVPVTASYQTSKIILDPLFWQALGKACNWREDELRYDDSIRDYGAWLYRAETFYNINLTEGFEKAVEYLETLINE